MFCVSRWKHFRQKGFKSGESALQEMESDNQPYHFDDCSGSASLRGGYYYHIRLEYSHRADHRVAEASPGSDGHAYLVNMTVLVQFSAPTLKFSDAVISICLARTNCVRNCNRSLGGKVHKVHKDCVRHVHQASLRPFRHVVFSLLDLSRLLH